MLAFDAAQGGEVMARVWTNSTGRYELILEGTSSVDAPPTLQFNVGRVYPHPALPGEIQVPYHPGPHQSATPELEVFDVWGRRVEGATALAAGLYFYRLRLGNQRTSYQSLILARGGPVSFRLMETLHALNTPGGTAKSLRAAAISIRVEKPGFRQVRQDLALGDGAMEIDFQLERVDGGRSRLVLAMRDQDDRVLTNVRATVHDLALTTEANAFGEVVLDSVYSGVAAVIHLERDGYMDQVVRMEVPAGLTLFRKEVVMPDQGEGQVLADAADGGEAQGADGARIDLPPGALVAADGSSVSGPVHIYMTPINVMTPFGYAAFPGDLLGIDETGREAPLLSYGATEFVLEQGGQQLDLAPGQTATIEMPLYATLNERSEPLEPGDPMPIWGLEETTGVWHYESMGTVVSAPSSPTGLALRGPVSHFSLFNCDVSPVAAAADLFALLDDDTCDVLGGTSSSAGCHGPAGYVRYDANLPDGYPRTSASGHAFVYDPETGLLDLPLPEGVSRAISATVAPEGFRMSTFLPADVDVELQVTTQGGQLRNRPGLWAGRWSETFRPTPNGQHSLQIQFDYALLSEGGRNEPLSVPASVLRSIDVDGEVDDFWFTGTVGAIAQLEACRLPASELEAEVALRSPSAITLDGTTLGERCARLHHQLAEAGKHVVAVRGLHGTTGGYEVTLDLASGLIPLVYYDSAFTAEAQRHRFGFTLDEPQTVVIGTRPTSGGVLGMRSELEDVEGFVLDVRTANTLSSAEIVHALPAGTYYVTQTLQADPPASYMLALLPLLPPVPISANTQYIRSIDLPFLRERFALTVVETTSVAVVTDPSDDLRLWARLLDASGNQLAATLSGRLERTLEPGAYLIEMDGHLMDVGSYGFVVEVD